MKRKKVRSKHNDLMNYFIHDERDLSPAYVKHCEKFLKELSNKQQAASLTSPKHWDILGS